MSDSEARTQAPPVAARRLKGVLASIIMVLVSCTIALGAAEAFLRIKNASMRNYDIEMWRYARLLKHRSDEPVLAFEHVPNKSAVLEGVNIRVNDWGLRGGPVPPLQPGERRILVLGSSITLGWGVREEDTLEARLQRMFAEQHETVQVLNGGIGNYNAVRYVNRFLLRLTGLHPTDIVVHAFVRDAEALDPGGGNVLLRNSELAVTCWIAFERYFTKAGSETVEEHYSKVYQPDAPGFLAMKQALRQLADYARQNHIRVYFAMTPDVHDLVDYKLSFVHDIMRNVAEQDGFTYIDLLPTMSKLTPQELWAMPGDPHPNALGHEKMAEGLFPALQLKNQ
jgi:lysophospholipase L1-like esterase